MDLGLMGKTALVTGAGSKNGFGKAIAMTLAKEGCYIIAVDADLDLALQTAHEVVNLGQKARALKADVTDKADADKMVNTVLAESGHIDILVNNIGNDSPMQRFVDSDETDWDLDIKLSYRGTLNCTKAVLPHMLKRKAGKIINLSSAGAVTGVNPFSTYTAANGAVLIFSKSLAAELGPSGSAGVRSSGDMINSGVNINIVATEQTSEPRPGLPQDVGNVVAFLASEGARRIAGQVVVV
jgi:NAD(P)-dependent dehydrogenase (short-subunit alcohol dehydrogenase family)